MTDGNLAETEQEETGLESEADADAENQTESDTDARGSASADSVGAYLRAMTSFSLLTREGEIEIAKRIEDGQRRVLQVVLDCSIAVDEILALGDELREAKVRVKDVVRDVDTDDPDFDEQWHVERIGKVFDKVRRLRKESAARLLIAMTSSWSCRAPDIRPSRFQQSGGGDAERP